MTVKRPDGRYTLFLNSSQPRSRHRFSVAHEVAHLLLDPILGVRAVHRRRFSKNQDPFGDQVEYLCNDMAAAILMPASHVKNRIASQDGSAECVPEIAASFDTSFEAAARRFVELNRMPCALVIWRKTYADGIAYFRNTIWNKPLGFCTVTFDERHLSDALQRFDRNAFRFVSTRETVAVIKGRGVRSTRSVAKDVTVESFARAIKGNTECWSFVRL